MHQKNATTVNPSAMAMGLEDGTTVDRPSVIGSDRYGQCVACRRHFYGAVSFDKHQSLRKDGSVICHDPVTRGLIIVERRGSLWWSRPPRPDGSWGSDNDDE